jgi:glyoxylase-like metal-dependent hydrolase (beta-lactamase superfamily II)
MENDGRAHRGAARRTRLASRRAVLQAALGGAAGLALGHQALRARPVLAQPRAGGTASLDLAADLFVLTAGGTNVVALTAADGVVLVDGGSRATSDALRTAVAALPGAGPVRTLFNTHWHPEQTGSNEALAASGAAIIAQENTKLWLSTDVTWPWNGETVEPLPAPARPNRSFYTRGELAAAGKPIVYGHLPDAPHTDGDCYVFFPQHNVLAVGGALNGDSWQLPDWWTGGWIGGLVGGLEQLLGVSNAETRIVPTRGPVLDYTQLKQQHEMYSIVWERLAKLLYTGRGPEEAVAARPTQEFDEQMGQPDEFVERSFRSLWAYLTPDA